MIDSFQPHSVKEVEKDISREGVLWWSVVEHRLLDHRGSKEDCILLPLGLFFCPEIDIEVDSFCFCFHLIVIAEGFVTSVPRSWMAWLGQWWRVAGGGT